MDKNDIRQVFENRAKKIKNTGEKNKKVFLHKQRMKLLSGIEGTILEVAVGRGNNFKYYDCKSNVVGVDFSP
ncbi:MAG: hypothetical protein JXQ26_02170, partial [Tissierellales bacterium]|nr:hypothetical protein [Tissierellales bacterium]